MAEQANYGTEPTITMRAAKARAAKALNRAFIVWHLENADRTHRLTGLAYVSREAALTDARLADFPDYSPQPFLRVLATERRWEVGRGRAGNDVRVARPVWTLTPICAIAMAERSA